MGDGRIADALRRHSPRWAFARNSLLVLTVFLALPLLGYQYVRELERVLRERAGAHARRHRAGGGDRAARPAAAVRRRPPIRSRRSPRERIADDGERAARRCPHPASPEIEQIMRRPVADRRADLGRRPRPERARARRIAAARAAARGAAGLDAGRVWQRPSARRSDASTRWCSSSRPRTSATRPRCGAAPRGRDIEGALAGILTIDRRRTPDGKAVDRRGGASDLGRRPGARRRRRRGDDQRACSPSATARSSGCSTSCSPSLLLGSVALTLFASRLSSRIRRLRDDAEAAIDANGPRAAARSQVRRAATRSATCRAVSRACLRGCPTTRPTRRRWRAACRTSCARRSRSCARRSTTCSTSRSRPTPAIYIERAQGGSQRLSAILTRMTEATRLEQALPEADARALRPRRRSSPPASTATGPRIPTCRFDCAVADGSDVRRRRARPGRADARQARRQRRRVRQRRPGRDRGGARRRRRSDVGVQRRAAAACGDAGRLFDSMVSVRPKGGDAHLGLGLYVVRLIAEFHGGSIDVANRSDGSGVVVSVRIPLEFR